METGADESEDGPYLLVLDAGEWYSQVLVDTQEKTLRFYGRTPDYDTERHSTFEYKFDGEQLFTKLEEDHTEHPGTDDWHVRDGVVLESEIRKRADGATFRFISADEEVSEYTSQITWHLAPRNIVRFFVMAKHPELFPYKALRKLMRGELERVRMVTQRVITEAKTLGVEIEETAIGFEFRSPKNHSEHDKKQAAQFFSIDSLEVLGTSHAELNTSKKLQAELLTLLGD